MIAVDQFIEEALRFPQTDRSYIASKLLESLDEDESETSEEWKSELDRRLQEMDDGIATMIPQAEVMAGARQRIAKKREERAIRDS